MGEQDGKSGMQASREHATLLECSGIPQAEPHGCPNTETLKTLVGEFVFKNGYPTDDTAPLGKDQGKGDTSSCRTTSRAARPRDISSCSHQLIRCPWRCGKKMKMAKLLREGHFADEIMGSPQPQQ